MKTKLHLRWSIIIALIIIIVQSAQAQTTDSFYLRTQYIFQHLEKSRITTGLLRDYGIDFIDIENYDGVQLSDTNQVAGFKWSDLYESLYTYQINTNAPLSLTPDSINSIIDNYQKGGVNPLSLLLIQYNKFRDDADSDNLVTISNDQIYDRYVSGVWQNPYETKNAFAIGTNNAVFSTDTMTFVLPSNLIFNNAGAIQSIQANFADSTGWHTLTIGQNIAVAYPDTGYKHIQFKVTLTDSRVFNSTAAIWVYYNSSQYARVAQLDNEEITVPATSAHSGGTMEIHYSAANQSTHQITKPLIIAEGFDPWRYQTPLDPNNNMDFDDFWSDYLIGNYGSNLSDLLDNDYDIIYVDYNNGTDDIKRNAALLEDVIQRVNTMKAEAESTEKNVVLGFSMGGLVARWALTEMEKNSIDHDTRLFISYDAPQQGANVPLGFQALNQHLANTKIKLGLFFGQIGYATTAGRLINPLRIYGTPAAKQLLMYYVKSNPNESLSMDNTVHNNFMADLYNLNTTTNGYPAQCRNIAVSNGADCATELSTIQPGAQLLRLSGHFNTRFLADLLLTALGGITSQIFTLTNYPQFLLTILPGRTDLKCSFTINATPSSGSIQLYNGRIYIQKKILWLIPVNVTLTKNTFDSPSGVLPVDNYPGGQYDINTITGNVKDIFAGGSFNNSILNLLLKRGLDDYYQASPTFTFVTKASALDIGEGQITLTEPDYLVRYEATGPPSPPKNTPFANFVTAMNSDRINEAHTEIETRLGSWVASELDESPQTVNCSAFCEDVQITGTTPFCSSQTFTVSNLGAGSSVSWSVSPATGVVDLSPSGSSVLVTKTGFGDATLKAVINTPCSFGSMTFTKSISTDPKVTSIDSRQYGCNGDYEQWFLTANANFSSTSNWNWTIDNPNNDNYWIIYSPHSQSTWVDVKGGTGGGISVTYEDPCGETSDKEGVTIWSSCGYGPMIAPNPATNTITITTNDQASQSKNFKTTQSTQVVSNDITSIKEVQIFDATGALKKQQIFSGNNSEVKMSIAGLAKGIYIVKISDGKHTAQQKLVVQ